MHACIPHPRRCLASLGVADPDVIRELLSHVSEKVDGQPAKQPNSNRHEAVRLLTFVSRKSTLVRSFVSEFLNSADYRCRMEAVELLPGLGGHPSRDEVDKLIDMMWNDWRQDIRDACVVALGVSLMSLTEWLAVLPEPVCVGGRDEG